LSTGPSKGASQPGKMMRGPHLLPLLALLGLSGSDGQGTTQAPPATEPVILGGVPSMTPAPQAPPITGTPCHIAMMECSQNYQSADGEDDLAVCAIFRDYQICFANAQGQCIFEKLENWKAQYNTIVLQLPMGCSVSTTPMDFSPSSDSFLPASSGSSVLPASGTSGGKTSGSSSIYMNWWQWLVFLCLCCCCCGGAGGTAAMRQRKVNRVKGGYGVEDQSSLFPQQDPQQAYPLVTPMAQPMAFAQQPNYMQQQSYAQMQQPSFAQQPLAAYPQQGYAQQGGMAYTANMPTTFQMQQPRW